MLVTAPGGGAIIDRMVLTVVPEPATMIAGALLLLPFALSTLRMLKSRKQKVESGNWASD